MPQDVAVVRGVAKNRLIFMPLRMGVMLFLEGKFLISFHTYTYSIQQVFLEDVDVYSLFLILSVNHCLPSIYVADKLNVFLLQIFYKT